MSLSGWFWTTGYGLLIRQACKACPWSPTWSSWAWLRSPSATPSGCTVAGRAGGAARPRPRPGRAMAEDRAAYCARDVHDSVGHHLTSIHMQATATRRAPAGGQAPTAGRALGTIGRAVLRRAERGTRLARHPARGARHTGLGRDRGPGRAALHSCTCGSRSTASAFALRCHLALGHALVYRVRAGGAHQRRPPSGCHQGGGASAAQPDLAVTMSIGRQRLRPCRSGGARHQGHARTRTPNMGERSRQARSRALAGWWRPSCRSRRGRHHRRVRHSPPALRESDVSDRDDGWFDIDSPASRCTSHAGPADRMRRAL